MKTTILHNTNWSSACSNTMSFGYRFDVILGAQNDKPNTSPGLCDINHG